MMVANIKISVNNDVTDTEDYVFIAQIDNSSDEVAQDNYREIVMDSLNIALEVIKEGEENEV